MQYFLPLNLSIISYFVPLSPRPLTQFCAKGVCVFQFEESVCCLVINLQLL